MNTHDYDEGKRDGKIESLEKMQAQQNQRLDKHENRISALEKYGWVVLGAVFIIQAFPIIKVIISEIVK